MFYIGGPIQVGIAITVGLSGIKIALSNLDLNLIPTSPVDLTKKLNPRVPGMSDVIVLNNRDKVVMCDPVQDNQECWLVDQHFFNPNCKAESTTLPDTIDLDLPNLKYDDAVNMKYITGLEKSEFTDKLDLGQAKMIFASLLRERR